MPHNSGFITLAFGKEYAEMAIDLALSVKEFHDEPISILADKVAADHIKKYNPSPFDQIHTIRDKIHPWGAKFLIGNHCKYDRAAFIDCDIIFLKHTNFLSYPLSKPLAMFGAYMDRGTSFKTYFDSSEIFEDFKLERYFWATSGIFFFDNQQAKPFFEDCLKFYKNGIRAYPKYYSKSIPDELVIGVIGQQYDIQSINCPTIHPWPMLDRLKDLSPDDHDWPSIHVFAPISEAYLSNLLAKINDRRRAHNFPQTSEKVWRNKANQKPSFGRKLKHFLTKSLPKLLPRISSNTR